MKTYLAHIAEDGREQSIEAHLTGTAKLCGAFANAFGAEEQGRLIGLLHDIGNIRMNFRTVCAAGRRWITLRQALWNVPKLAQTGLPFVLPDIIPACRTAGTCKLIALGNLHVTAD